ncbi:PREDICTED: protein NUCLEAR FUSION DEFECTIVE 4-like isoform X2 [Tarenaya hassleriana]|uniref:protein NUCLEAR FUSION DEFECTIVE 4-like isoform X2 n=1 Tax=Tarenaya hassleriana TaxID=28532 RepID=UPI00053C6CA0|nr:PREDICTED: protein NUCLEAR FUSION DEFECTIVE 4-like isoform X2 [Tarenaya hassleriana]
MVERPWNTKWLAAVASIWIQCFTGASYAFGIYSSILKTSQSYDQSTLDAVSVSKDIGANVGILSGLLYTAVASSSSGNGFFKGPWIVVFIGLLQWFFGYFFIWASVVGFIDRPPMAAMCFFMFLAGHSQPFFNTANVVTAVRNFSDYGGTAVGIMKGFLGLSGAILVQMYHTLSEGNPSAFILQLAIVPSLIVLLAMPFVRAYDTTDKSDKTHLDCLSLISLIIVAYLMSIILLENVLGLSRSFQTSFFLLLVFMLSLPLLVAIRAQKLRFSSSPLESPVHDRAALLDPRKPEISSEVLVESDDLNVIQAMCTMNFWLLFIAMICGMGTGLATVNNIRQIGESLNYPTVQLNALVSLWSIWNFLGRFGAGYISDIYLHKYAWPRPVFMAITLSVLAVGHGVMASGLQGNLYMGSLLVGLAYGSQWSLMPTITSEIFGIKHMGTIYYTISIASPVGSYIFSVKVIGYLYDKVAASEDDHTCVGSHCFRASFVIMSAVALVGSLVDCVLFFRTKRFYAKLAAKRIID